MTFQQLYDDALDVELSSEDLTQLFTTARRKAAVNLAQSTFARMTGCTKRYAELSMTTGVAEYDVEDDITITIAGGFVRLAGALSIKITSGTVTRWIQGNDSFPRRDAEELDRDMPGWRAASPGTPTFWYLREEGGPTLLGVNPPPLITGSDVWKLLTPYIADPPAMVNNSDQPFTFVGNTIKRLAVYHQALAHYAAAQLEPLRKNYTGVTRQMQMYSGYVAQYLQDQRANGRDQVTLLRDYYSDSRRSARPMDPRSWP